ncbi:hypothetical protein ACFW9X_36770, partial [Streptomyces sp. NPDC059466]
MTTPAGALAGLPPPPAVEVARNAQARRLGETERRHLLELAAGARRRTRTRRAAPERVSPALAQLTAALDDVPVVVLGRRSDVLAWNRAGHALYAGHLDPEGPDRPGERPNMARLVFLDDHTRDLYVDWSAKARAVVGALRLASGRVTPDPAPAAPRPGQNHPAPPVDPTGGGAPAPQTYES